MIKGDLQNAYIRKIKYQRTGGQVRSETLLLPSKYSKPPLQDNLPNTFLPTPRRFISLPTLNSEKK
jgi:hypothetical protein